MGDPTLQTANEIETLLRDNGFNATITSASADTIQAVRGPKGTEVTGLTLTIQVDL